MSKNPKEYLSEYFKNKKEYINNFSVTDDFKIYNIFDVKTNMPVKFYEKNGEYIVEIIDNKDKNKVYYRKTFIIKDTINLSVLYHKYHDELMMKNVEFTKINYLNRIDEINQRRSKIEAINKSLIQPNNEIQLSLQEINKEYDLLKIEFDQWFASINKILIQIDIINQIKYELLKNDQTNMNEYTMSYYWLNSKMTKNNDDSHYIMSKLIIQSGPIKSGYVLKLKYSNLWYIVTNVNNTQLTIQNLQIPFDSKIVSSDNVLYNQGSFHIFKDYKYVNGTPIVIDEWVSQLPDNAANSIVAKLTYQKETFNIDDIVLYNNDWYLINTIENDNIIIMSLIDNHLETVSKSSVIHPIGYRNKYNKVYFTDKIILPIDNWIKSLTNVNQSFIDNKTMYQSNNINKGDVVRYNNNWYIVVNIFKSTNDISIQNLENVNDRDIKNVKISDVTHSEGYYHKYKKFRITDDIIVSKKDWINRLNGYNITTSEIIDEIDEKTEYPSTNGARIPLIYRTNTENLLQDKKDKAKQKRETKKQEKSEEEKKIKEEKVEEEKSVENEYNEFIEKYEMIINEFGEDVTKYKEPLTKLTKIGMEYNNSKNKKIKKFIKETLIPKIEEMKDKLMKLRLSKKD
jgi:hypothetical protein